MFKKKDFKNPKGLDNYGGAKSDFDYDLGDFDVDFDLEEPVKKDTRSPVTKGVSGVATGAFDKITNKAFITSTITSAVPDGYGTAIEMADKTAGALSDAYSESVRRLKPSINAMTRQVDKLVPKELARTKALLNKVIGASNREDTYSGTSKVTQRNEAVESALASVFDKQNQIESQQRAEDRADDKVKIAMDMSKHKDLTGLLSGVSTNVASLRAYNENVITPLERKKLELSMRTLYTLEDLLELSTKSFAAFETNQATIVHNTGLPDLVKARMSEDLAKSAKSQLFGHIGNAVFKNNDLVKSFTDTINKKLNNVTRAAGQVMETVTDQLTGIAQAKEELGLDVTSFAGGVVGDSLVEKHAKKLAKWAKNKYFRPGSDHEAKAASMARVFNDPTGYIKRYLSDKKFNEYEMESKGFLAKMMLSLQKDILSGAVKGTGDTRANLVTINSAQALNDRTDFDNLTKKTITTIIPGYLSKILYQVTWARTGKQPEEVMYNVRDDKFTYGKNKFKEEVLTGLRKDAGVERFTERSSQVMEQLDMTNAVKDGDKEIKLSANEQKFLTGAIQIASMHNLAGDRDMIGSKELQATPEYRDLRKKLKLDSRAVNKVSIYLKRRLRSLQSQNEFSAAYNAMKASYTGTGGLLQSLLDQGHGGMLKDMGLVSKDKDASTYHTTHTNVGEMYGHVTATSDVTAKEDIKPIKESWAAKFGRLGSYMWRYKPGKGDGGAHVGPMAQEVNAVMDEGKKSGKDVVAPQGTKLDLVNMSGAQSGAISELYRLVATLGKKITGRGQPTETVTNQTEPSVKGTGDAKMAETLKNKDTNDKKSKEVLMGHLSAGVDKVKTKGKKIKDTAKDKGKGFANTLRAYAKDTGTNLSGNIKGLMANATALSIDLTNTVMKRLGKMAKYGKKKIKKGGKATGEWWGDNKDDIKKFVKESATSTFEFFKDTAETIKDKLVDIKNDFIPKQIDRITAFGKKMGGLVLEVIEGDTDVYVVGLPSPKLYAATIRNGGYKDQLTGKTINKPSDVRGPVIDLKGNVVLSAEDLQKGLVDNQGKPIVNASGLLRRAFLGGVFKASKKVKDLFKSLTTGNEGAFDYVKGKFKGFFNGMSMTSSHDSKSYNVLLDIRAILAGQAGIKIPKVDGGLNTAATKAYAKVASVAGKARSFVYTRLPGAKVAAQAALETVQTKAGNARVSVLDAINKYRPIVAERLDNAKSNIRYKAVIAKHQLAGALSDAEDYVKDNAPKVLAAGNRARIAAVNKTMTGIGKGKLMLKGAKAKALGLLSKTTAPAIEQPSEQPADKRGWLRKGMSTIGSAYTTAKTKVKDKLAGVAAPPATNTEGHENQAAAAQAQRDEPEMKYKGGNVISRMLDGFGSIVSSITGFLSPKSMLGGLITSTLGTLLNPGGLIKSVLGVLGVGGSALKMLGGKGILNAGAPLLGGVARGVAGMAGSALGSLAKGGASLIGGGLSGAASIAGTLARGLLFTAPAAVAGAVASTASFLVSATTAMATIISSPPVLAAAATAAVAYGGYKLYKHYANKKHSKLQDIRFKQYGLSEHDRDYYGWILGLEDFFEKKVKFTGDGARFDGGSFKAEDVYDAAGINKDNEDSVNQFTKWFKERFSVVYLSHRTAAAVCGLKTFDDLDSDQTPSETIRKYLTLIDIPASAYSVTVTGVTGQPLFACTPKDVELAILEARKQESLVEYKPKTGTKVAAAVAAIKEKDAAAAEAARKASEIDPFKPRADNPVVAANTAANVANGVAGQEGEPKQPFVMFDAKGSSTPVGMVDANYASKPPASGPLASPESGDPFIVKGKGVNLDGINPALGDNLRAMAGEFGAKTGRALDVTSGVRTSEQQARLYRENPAKAAPPGRSLHEFGIAVDIDSKDLNEADRLGLLSKYAFTRPLPKEPWHLEPIGIQKIKQEAKHDPALATSAIAGALKGTLGDAGTASSAPTGTASPTGTTNTQPLSPSAPTPAKSDLAKPVSTDAFKTSKVNSDIQTTLKAAADAAGVDPGLLSKMAQIESSMNPNAKAKGPNQTAGGLFGFTDGTWRSMIAKYGAKYGLDPSASKFDPKASALMAAEYIKSNKASVSKFKENPTDTDVYAAHFLGAGGAKQLLSADPNMIAANILPIAAANNVSTFYDGSRPRTVGEVYALLGKKVGGAGGATTSSGPVTANVAPQTPTTNSVFTGAPVRTPSYNNQRTASNMTDTQSVLAQSLAVQTESLAVQRQLLAIVAKAMGGSVAKPSTTTIPAVDKVVDQPVSTPPSAPTVRQPPPPAISMARKM